MSGTELATEAMTAQAMTWGVAHVRPYSAELAKADLRKAGLRVFAPMVKTVEVKHFGRRKTLAQAIVRPMFRGYLFFGWRAGTDEWAPAPEAHGVLDVLRSCGKLSPPAPVRRQIMDALMKAGELIDLTTKPAIAPRQAIAPGDLVTVNRAGFEDRIWRVARLDGRSRIRFLLNSVRPGFEKFELKASAEDLVKVEA